MLPPFSQRKKQTGYIAVTSYAHAAGGFLKELNSDRILLRLDKLIETGNHLITTTEDDDERGMEKRNKKDKNDYVNYLQFLKFRVSALHFIESTVGKNSIFYQEFNSIIAGRTKFSVKEKIYILQSLHEELKDMWYWSAQGLAHAGVFSNMLEEAQHLLDREFITPSAVLAGCVLECHLKNLCLANGITVSIVKDNGKESMKKASTLDHELYTHGIYGATESKEITFYQGIRNHAAHGEQEKISSAQVKMMIQGIASFVARNPV